LRTRTGTSKTSWPSLVERLDDDERGAGIFFVRKETKKKQTVGSECERCSFFSLGLRVFLFSSSDSLFFKVSPPDDFVLESNQCFGMCVRLHAVPYCRRKYISNKDQVPSDDASDRHATLVTATYRQLLVITWIMCSDTIFRPTKDFNPGP